MMSEFCIITPIYKETPDILEVVSLRRLWQIIKDKGYKVFYVTHKGLDISKYYDIEFTNKTDITEIYFDDKYFNSNISYSQLCLSYDFYNTFNEFEYMYIYQTDCYLVDDKFSEFCKLGYDYIGSPIFSTDCGWPTTKIDKNGNEIYKPVIGNGGFSLRKISTFCDVCNPNGEFRKTLGITDYDISTVAFEDMYFGVFVQENYSFSVAPLEIGIKFSWDMNADIMYNHWDIKTLPMAIHAWDKNIRLWKTLLPEIIGNETISAFCEEKHKKLFNIYYDENDSTLR